MSLDQGTRRTRDCTRVGRKPLENWATFSSLVMPKEAVACPGAKSPTPVCSASSWLGPCFGRELSQKCLCRKNQDNNPASPESQSSFLPPAWAQPPPLLSSSWARQGQVVSVKHKLPTAPLSNRFQVPCSIWKTAIFLLRCTKEGCTGTEQQSPSSLCVLAWSQPWNCQGPGQDMLKVGVTKNI